MDTPFKRTQLQVSLDPKELQDFLDELKASRISRKTAWDIPQELRSVLNEHGVILASPAVKNIGVEGRLVCDGAWLRRHSPAQRNAWSGPLVPPARWVALTDTMLDHSAEGRQAGRPMARSPGKGAWAALA
jgi:hypothetical protein